MLGSYGPQAEPYIKNFDPEESPSGLLARSGSYSVRSRVVDDDGEVYAGEKLSAKISVTLLSINRLGLVFQARQGMVISIYILSCPRMYFSFPLCPFLYSLEAMEFVVVEYEWFFDTFNAEFSPTKIMPIKI